jgi:phosphatidylserine/phosphatidylglycerophosphate/cardiolipin synthase-like enzyme
MKIALPRLVAFALAAAGAAYAAAPVTELSVVAGSQRESADVRVAFTPGDNIAGIIIEEIRAAKSSIRIQAYLFTSTSIANALVNALKRGVKVDIIVDATEYENGNTPVLLRLSQAGASIYLNSMHKSSHNKIVIVDAGMPRATVITGSYNFTRAAQTQNAENVVVLSGNIYVIQRFNKNWEFHRARSTLLH